MENNAPVPPQTRPEPRTVEREQQQFTPWNAISKNRVVYIPYKSELMELREKGFGILKAEKLLLTAYESFYLTEKQRIRVFTTSDRELGLHELVLKLSVGQPEIWIKYLVYRDLRDRGYIVRESTKNFDFDVYGKGPIRRLISIVYEGGEASLRKLGKLLRLADEEKKELILAVVDRRTDIVYYSLSSLKV